MAVREFDGVDDSIRCDPGAIGDITFAAFSVALLTKFNDTVAGAPFYAENAAMGDGSRCDVETFGGVLYFAVEDTHVSMGTVSAREDVWRLVVLSKAAGTDTPRYHDYDFSTATWTHQDGSGTLPDGTNTLSFVDFGPWNSAEVMSGRIAVVGLFRADFTDSALEAAGLEAALQNWLDQGADALWPLNQPVATDPVLDITGNGADQTAITGTTVITTDDPPGFDFTLSSAPPEATCTIPLSMVLTSATETELRATTEIPLSLALAASSETAHAVTADIPLSVTFDATTVAAHAVSATIPLDILLDATAAVQHEATAAIPLTLMLSGTTFTGELVSFRADVDDGPHKRNTWVPDGPAASRRVAGATALRTLAGPGRAVEALSGPEGIESATPEGLALSRTVDGPTRPRTLTGPTT